MERSIKVVDFTHGKKDSDNVNTNIPFKKNFAEAKTIQSANVIIASYTNKNISDLAKLENKTNVLENDLNTLNNKTNVLEADVTNLNNKTSVLEADVTNLNNEIKLKADKTEIPTKTSDLTNDSGYITNEYHDVTKQDVLVSGTNIKTINGNSVLGSGNLVIESGSGDYNDLTNKPSINSVSLVGNKTLDDLDIQSKITAINKIPYSNISDTPDLTDYAKLDELNTFEHDQTIKSQMYSGLVLENGSNPSEFANLGYDGFRKNNVNVAWSNIATTMEVSAKQDILVSGSNIKTVNGNSLLGSGDIEIAGRIIETGEANSGHYVKYDTGLLICTKEVAFSNIAVSVGAFAGTYGANVNLGNMPYNFVNLWTINGIARPSNTADWLLGNIYNASNTSMGQARLCRPQATGSISGKVSITAIGTWK